MFMDCERGDHLIIVCFSFMKKPKYPYEDPSKSSALDSNKIL